MLRVIDIGINKFLLDLWGTGSTEYLFVGNTLARI